MPVYRSGMKRPEPPDEDPSQAGLNRIRILKAAIGLIERDGPDAATTRAVAAAAGVQAPTIYRLFGDKRGLLDAVALHQLDTYVAEKSTRAPDPDPVEDLRAGWDMHVAFGLAHPGVFAILSGHAVTGPSSGIVKAGLDVLQRRVRNLALAGRLATSEERAINLLRSSGTGTVLTLLAQPEDRRDMGLSAAARESVISTITGGTGSQTVAGPNAAAAALRASLDQTSVLTDGERHLMAELLDRIACGPRRPLSEPGRE